MKDCLNRRSEYLLNRRGINTKARCLHRNSPEGLNNILWQQLSFGEDHYISAGALKYLEYNNVIWPRPTKP